MLFIFLLQAATTTKTLFYHLSIHLIYAIVLKTVHGGSTMFTGLVADVCVPYTFFYLRYIPIIFYQ